MQIFLLYIYIVRFLSQYDNNNKFLINDSQIFDRYKGSSFVDLSVIFTDGWKCDVIKNLKI